MSALPAAIVGYWLLAVLGCRDFEVPLPEGIGMECFRPGVHAMPAAQLPDPHLALPTHISPTLDTVAIAIFIGTAFLFSRFFRKVH